MAPYVYAGSLHMSGCISVLVGLRYGFEFAWHAAQTYKCANVHDNALLCTYRTHYIGGHDGYDKPLGGSLVHYLHHTKFNVNYGTPVVPFDEW